MRESITKVVIGGLGAFLVMCAATVQAAPITFDFVFQDLSGTASAVGFVTFEESLLPNPQTCSSGVNFFPPDPAVLALEVTVSGAASGNGTFALSSFSSITWCTNGATLDLSAQLVGQATPNDPWGTPSGGDGGDFNLFGSAPRPNGEFYFTLCANGGAADCMTLTSMIVGPLRLPPSIHAPALGPASLALLTLAMLALGAHGLRRRVDA